MKLSPLDRFLIAVAPDFGLRRVRARVAADSFARAFEAGSPSRRTSGYARSVGDANTVIAKAGDELRVHSRRLLENNGYARRAQSVIVNNVVGWGAVPRSKSTDPAVQDLWNRWSESKDCDADGSRNFVGLQAAVMRAVFSDGEVIVRRRQRRMSDGFILPMQIQLQEADYLDRGKSGKGLEGGVITQGVERDGIGRLVALWIFDEHPGSLVSSGARVSRRISTDQARLIRREDRLHQVRGVPWLAAAIVNMSDLDEYEDAELVKQKIAACFAAFVTDTDGAGTAIGALDGSTSDGNEIETFEPGMIHHLPPGRDVVVANPPQVTNDSVTTRTLRKIAAGLGITYEDLTGDYSQVNFSSARMGRLVHQASVRSWQTEILVPQFCEAVWEWALDVAERTGEIAPTDTLPAAEWSTAPLPMIEPDKESLALIRAVRGGFLTWSDAVREMGADPAAHFAKYAADMKILDSLGIKLDSDVRAVSQAGLTQERVGSTQNAAPTADQKPA